MATTRVQRGQLLKEPVYGRRGRRQCRWGRGSRQTGGDGHLGRGWRGGGGPNSGALGLFGGRLRCAHRAGLVEREDGFAQGVG